MIGTMTNGRAVLMISTMVKGRAILMIGTMAKGRAVLMISTTLRTLVTVTFEDYRENHGRINVL